MACKAPIKQVRPGLWERTDGTAEAIRYYKGDTGSWSGWIVRSRESRHHHSDPIRTKAEALTQLRTWGNPCDS